MPMSLMPKRPRVRPDVTPFLAYCRQMLRQARDEQGLTLEALAARTGIVKSVIADFETGRRGLSLEDFLRLGIELRVPFADLLPPAEPSVLGRLLLHIHARGPAWVQALLALHETPLPCPKRRR
jgi:transcriptional regulator with XRE-family HTH domain